QKGVPHSANPLNLSRYVAHGSILAAALAYGVTGSEDLRYAELPFVPATTLAFLPQRFGETV
ncbi:MAG TPA: hypothetical protein VN792_00435, partial [Candidatus Acidoferrales bacterium]|nr:hypothetical protein [Candidatus Acidoferrales bacterium]